MSPAGPGNEGIRLERWTVTSGSNVNSRAAVVLHGAGRDWNASAEGNGAVDALLRAVDAALADVVGGRPRLVSYDVHALAEGPDAEGRVTVRISPPADASGARADGAFSGEIASTNIVAASVEAYIGALNAMLASPSWAGAAEVAASGPGAASAGSGEAATATTEIVNEHDIDTNAWFNH